MTDSHPTEESIKKKVNEIGQKNVKNQPKSKLTSYRCYEIPNIKSVYLRLFNDNITDLIGYIYAHQNTEPYNNPEIRVALSIQMVMSSDHLIPISLSTQIAKDLEKLRKSDDYTSKWANPMMKRQRLHKELEILKKHTEIDDSISLNLAEKEGPTGEESQINLEDYDIHSSVSTLNVSASCPIEEEGRCVVM